MRRRTLLVRRCTLLVACIRGFRSQSVAHDDFDVVSGNFRPAGEIRFLRRQGEAEFLICPEEHAVDAVRVDRGPGEVSWRVCRGPVLIQQLPRAHFPHCEPCTMLVRFIEMPLPTSAPEDLHFLELRSLTVVHGPSGEPGQMPRLFSIRQSTLPEFAQCPLPAVEDKVVMVCLIGHFVVVKGPGAPIALRVRQVQSGPGGPVPFPGISYAPGDCLPPMDYEGVPGIVPRRGEVGSAHRLTISLRVGRFHQGPTDTVPVPDLTGEAAIGQAAPEQDADFAYRVVEQTMPFSGGRVAVLLRVSGVGLQPFEVGCSLTHGQFPGVFQ